jgi:hypothetical protein
MALPLPKVVADTGPGGGLVTAMQGMNALNKSSLENQYYAPNMQSQIGYRNALMQGQNIENQYMPEKLKLANAFAGLQNQYYAPNIQSEINNRNALTNKYNTMTPLEARELEIKNQFGAQREQANINSQKAMANYRNMGGSGMGVGQKQIMGLQQQLVREHPDWSPEQANQAASAYIAGDNQLPDGTALPPISGIGQSYVDQIVKQGTTAQGLNQQRFAATTDAILDQGKDLLPIVSQYAGTLGKAQGGLDAVQSSLGANSPSYQKYLFFTRTFVPYAAGEMMRALGVNASDTQKELYQQVINPISWDQNPAGAMENYKQMTNLFKKTVSQTIGKTTGELRAGLRKSSSSKATLRYNQATGDFEEIR